MAMDDEDAGKDASWAGVCESVAVAVVMALSSLALLLSLVEPLPVLLSPLSSSLPLAFLFDACGGGEGRCDNTGFAGGCVVDSVGGCGVDSVGGSGGGEGEDSGGSGGGGGGDVTAVAADGIMKASGGGGGGNTRGLLDGNRRDTSQRELRQAPILLPPSLSSFAHGISSLLLLLLL